MSLTLTKKQVQAMLDRTFAPLEKAVRKSRGTSDSADKKDKTAPFSISKYLRGIMKGNWTDADAEKTQFDISKQLGLNVGVGTAGGFMVTPQYNMELIELLRSKAVIRNMGPRVYPMSGNTMFFNAQTGAAQAFWVGEGENKDRSQQAVGQRSLVLKEVAGIVVVTNDMIEDASPAVDALVKGDLVKVLTLAEDLAFIQGTGGLQPLGIYNDPAVPNVTLGGGNGALPSFDNLWNALNTIETANAESTGWLMHPRTKNTLRTLKDGDGRYLYNVGDLSKGEQDSLLGLPVFKSTQIPTNLTFGTSAANCSYMILGDWREFSIGEKAGKGIVLDVDKSIHFYTDETAIRAVRRVDCLVRQPNAFLVIRGILP